MTTWVGAKLKSLGYFQLLAMRYDDRNVVAERISITVLQLYLIWTTVQILEHISSGWSKTRPTPTMDFSVTLVDSWRPQVNNTTKTTFLDAEMVLDTFLWNNYYD